MGFTPTVTIELSVYEELMRKEEELRLLKIKLTNCYKIEKVAFCENVLKIQKVSVVGLLSETVRPFCDKDNIISVEFE